jgi:hypothetical protein
MGNGRYVLVGRIYLSTIHSDDHQIMYGFGPVTDSGSGARELRSGGFTVTSAPPEWFKYEYESFGQGFATCRGDSGANLGLPLINSGNLSSYRFAVAGVHSGATGSFTGSCTDYPFQGQVGTRTNAHISWIETSLGRACPRFAVGGKTVADCRVGAECTFANAQSCAAFGCGCAQNQCSGGACPSCTAQNTQNCAAFGCGCLYNQCTC